MKKKIWIIISLILVALAGSMVAMNRERIVSAINWGTKDCVPFNARINAGESLSISWKTESSCTAIVKYGADLEDLQYWTSVRHVDGRYVASLDGSKYGDVKYVVIVSNGVSYGIDGKAIKVD